VDRGDPVVGRALAGTDRYVLALGTIEPRKDLPTLVAAFDAVAGGDRDLRLVVAGPDGWGQAAFDEAVGRAAHRDRVVRLGWVDGADRAGLLAGATVFAYPSLYEGFGFPPLEAMSVGVPVVTTSAGALVEVLGDAARFAAPGDVDDLAQALLSVLTDLDVRHELATLGRARVDAYSWDRCADGLVELYRSVLR
jgi:glycosyltransferase involved in cell wall biosynthesis